MPKTYPRSLAGLYAISFKDQTLKPIRLIDTKASDCQLAKIEFRKNRIGKAIFENGVHFSFPVKWDAIRDSYTFLYNNSPHLFSPEKELKESGEVAVSETVDVMSLTDLDPKDFEN